MTARMPLIEARATLRMIKSRGKQFPLSVIDYTVFFFSSKLEEAEGRRNTGKWSRDRDTLSLSPSLSHTQKLQKERQIVVLFAGGWLFRRCRCRCWCWYWCSSAGRDETGNQIRELLLFSLSGSRVLGSKMKRTKNNNKRFEYDDSVNDPSFLRLLVFNNLNLGLNYFFSF